MKLCAIGSGFDVDFTFRQIRTYQPDMAPTIEAPLPTYQTSYLGRKESLWQKTYENPVWANCWQDFVTGHYVPTLLFLVFFVIGLIIIMP